MNAVCHREDVEFLQGKETRGSLKKSSYCVFFVTLHIVNVFTCSCFSTRHTQRISLTIYDNHKPGAKLPQNMPFSTCTRGSRTSFECRSSIARHSRREEGREGRKGREGSRSWVLKKQHQSRRPSDSKNALLVLMCSGMPDLPSTWGEPPDCMHYRGDLMGQ